MGRLKVWANECDLTLLYSVPTPKTLVEMTYNLSLLAQFTCDSKISDLRIIDPAEDRWSVKCPQYYLPSYRHMLPNESLIGDLHEACFTGCCGRTPSLSTFQVPGVLEFYHPLTVDDISQAWGRNYRTSDSQRVIYSNQMVCERPVVKRALFLRAATPPKTIDNSTRKSKRHWVLLGCYQLQHPLRYEQIMPNRNNTR